MSSSPSLIIRIGADASSATREIHNTTQNIQNLGSQVNNTTSHVNHYNTIINNLANESNHAANSTRNLSSATNGLYRDLKSVAGLIGGGMFFKSAIQEIATFETKLLSLKALTMANTDQMKLMEKQARELGATTAFSAQQAAEAQGVLASTGLKVNEILKAIPQILQLAAAGSLDLAKAAEISMATMKGLGLQLQDLGHINDVFAKVAADSAINVEQVGVAMGEAAPSMRAFGVSLETTAAAIGILKDNGIKVGSIGDGLKSMMGALANETKENTKILEKHNLTYKDLNVETLGLTKVLNNLKGANLTAAESIKVLGLDAFNVTKILINNTQALENNGNSLVKTSGDAQTQADILNQGLAKAWDALLGSLGEAAQQFGEAGTKIDETGKATGGLKVGLTELITEATGVIAIYEGMGDQFAKSNKLTAEQYGHLKDVSGELRAIGSAAIAVAAVGVISKITLAIREMTAAQVLFNIQARLNPYIAGTTVVAAGAGYVYDKMNQYNERQKGHLKEVNTLEEANLSVQRQQLAVKNLTAIGGSEKTLGIAKAQLDALKQQRDAFEKSIARPTSEIVNETNQWLDDLSGKKIKPPHSKSLDVNDDSAAKKSATAAQREHNKELREYQQLIDKFNSEDPFKEYAQSMAELNSVRGKIDADAFALNEKKIAAEFEKSTVNLNVYNQALREREQLFNATARGKFEKTDSELRAAKSFMSENEYLAKQSAMVDAYLKDTGHEIKKDNSEQITKAYENEWEALQKIRREITLNSDAEYEAHIRKQGFSEERIAKLKEEHEAIKGLKLLDDIGLSVRGLAQSFSSMFSQVLTQGKSFTDALRGMFKSMVSKISDGLMNFGMNAMMSGNFLAGGAAMVGSIGTGLLSSLFGDKEENLRANTETTLTDSKTLQNIISTLNDIHSKEYKELQGINDNFTLISKGIDNTINRAIAWNGSFTPSTNGMTSTSKGFGAKDAVGIALGGITTAITTGVTAGMAAASTAASLGASTAAATSAGIGMGAMGAVAGLGAGIILAGAIYGLGKILGIGKTKYTAIGSGLVTEPAKLIDVAAGKALETYNYSTVKATTKTWFGNKSKIYDVINSYNDTMSDAFSEVFAGIYNGMSDAINKFGVTGSNVDYNMRNTVIPQIKTPNLTGKTDAEISEILTKTINTVTDQIATSIMGGLLKPLAKSGEATLETLYRLVQQVAIVKSGFHKLGMDVKATGMEAVVFANSIDTVFESAINAKDGMKQFSSAINDFYDAVLTTGEKTALTISDYRKFVSENPQLGLTADPSKVSGSQMVSALETAKAAAEAAAKIAEPIVSRGQAVQDAFDPIMAAKLDEIIKNSGQTNQAAWQYALGVSDLSKATWDTARPEWANFFKAGARPVDVQVSAWLDEKKAKQESGQAAIAGSGITSIEQQEAVVATLQADMTGSVAV